MKKVNKRKAVPIQQEEFFNEAAKSQFKANIIKTVEGFQGHLMTALSLLDEVANEMTKKFESEMNLPFDTSFDDLLSGIDDKPIIDMDNFFAGKK